MSPVWGRARPNTVVRPAHRASRLRVEKLEGRWTPNAFIPTTDARDLVYDAGHDLLYVTTTSGNVLRFDVATNTQLAPVSLGAPLNGADITPDGRFLYVADGQRGLPVSVFFKVDLDALTSKQVPFDHTSAEDGAYDIAIGPNGKALVSYVYPGSGDVELRLLDTATDTYSLTGIKVQGRTSLPRGADRHLVLVAEPNISSGPVQTYDFGTNTLSPEIDTWQSINGTSAINRDSTLIATKIIRWTAVTDRSLNAVQTLEGIDGAIAFDPSRDVFYGVNSEANQIVAYDTNTWAEKFRLDVGVFTIGTSTMTVADDGSRLFLVTETGVHVYDRPADTGTAASLRLSGVSTFRAPGTATTVTVSALDPGGNVATGYTGTVTFNSTDPVAGLPPSYTFTAVDAGTRSFDVTWNTPGSRTLTVVDAAHGFSATTSAITVHGNTIALIPVTRQRDLVFDNVHNQLLISTGAGTLERYDVATQSLLAPLKVGGSLNGMDITPDGSAAYVADGDRNLTQSVVRRVDLIGGATTLLGHTGDTGGAWDVVIGANGLGLVDYAAGTPNPVQLSRLDTVHNTVGSPVRTVEYNTSLFRGADRSLVFGVQGASSTGMIFTYDPVAGSVLLTNQLNTLLDNHLAAVDRSGGRLALERGAGTLVQTVTPSFFGGGPTLAGINGGMAFDSARDVFYGVNSATNQVVAYDSKTWTEKYRFDVGEDVGASAAFGSGVMAVSADGHWLFLSTPSGVRMYNVAPTLVVSAPTLTTPGAVFSFTLTAQTPGGAIDPSYRGTVIFSGSDSAATLPTPYTFTAADAGRHTFTAAALRLLGDQTIAAKDDQFSLSQPVVVTVRPVRTTPLVVNDGATQRSVVTSLTVAFNAVVNFVGGPANAPTAFVLQGPAGTVGLNVDLSGSTATQTVARITFTGPGVIGGSLADGNYTLTILAAQVVDLMGNQLDGNSDGSPGGNDVESLYRLFGDANGDRVVNGADLSLFIQQFGGLVATFDFNADGVVNGADLTEFISRFGVGLSP